MGRNALEDPESPGRHRGSRRERSPVLRSRSSNRGGSFDKARHPGRGKSPKHESPCSPISRSPSPQMKRVRRAQAEKEVEKLKEREYEKHNGRRSDKYTERERGGERDRNREREKDRDRDRDREREKENMREKGREGERGSEREVRGDRRERRSGRDDERDDRHSRARRELSTSPSNGNHRSRHQSHSPPDSRDDEGINSRGGTKRNDENDALAKMKAAEEALAAKQKEQPSFELSGKLAAETNRFRGVTLLFSEPPDARKPNIRWRLYVFKGGEVLNEPLYIHRQSCYLFGRERRVADIPTDHPSCSKQHAVIQFRQVEKEQPDGTMVKQVRPYIMDLGSTNKTYINENPIEPQRYYELFEKDTIKFGNSSREYVLLHEESAG